MFKKMKALTTVCPICESERKVLYGTNKETINVRGENISVLAKVFYCPDGDHFFANLDDEEEKIQHAFRVFRERNKLLQPEEIKQIRNKYKLSQEAFSAFLGFGKKTIHRYETGAIPDDPHNSFIKLMQDTRNFILQYKQIKGKLNERLRQKIEKRINELESAEFQLPLLSSCALQPDAVIYTTTTSKSVHIGTSDWSWMRAMKKEEAYMCLSELKMTYKKKNNFPKELALAA